MGSPQTPTRDQFAALEKAGQLQPLEPPRAIAITGGTVTVTFRLPRQGVSLVRIAW
jgi:xylan 1,4-beta-xylosidase